MNLNPEYIVTKFYQYAGFPVFKRYTNTYNACCPTCREGKSWGKKKRLYYIVKDNYIFCQNCQKSFNPINWIMEQSGMSYSDVLKEAQEFSSNINILIKEEKPINKPNIGTLPEDSINLFDSLQLKYYENNKVIQDALKYIQNRRLNTAINKPRALFISLKDFLHKNRIILPFYNEDNQIDYYQTRAIYKKDEIDKPKYLSKLGAEKTIFGIHNIDPELDYLFIFEGPIDSCFVKNGIAVGGISTTELQEEKLNKFKLLNRIWILDNQLDNKEVKSKLTELIERGEHVFLWPKEYENFKDINEICQKYNIDQISYKFFIKHSSYGIDALTKLSI